eukprot:Skav222900  [mRNA]  locus=scaffold1489:23076:40643:+ [translate_table: standard]
MDGSSSPPLDATELRAVSQTLTVKELKKLLKDLQVDVTRCLEKSELLQALVQRLERDEKMKASLFTYCRICCNWCLDDDVWPLTCGHLVCFQCLGNHLESQVQVMKSSLTYKLPCIYAPACDHEIRFQDAASMSDAFRRIWKDLQRRERLIRDAKFEVLECPKPDCVGVAYKERGKRMAMCFLCEHAWEANPCGHEKEWEKPGFDGERVRRCPKCQAPIEKNGGCNHMVCTRCGRNFDWGSSQPAGERSTNGSTQPEGGSGGPGAFDFGAFADFFGSQGAPFQGWQTHMETAANQARLQGCRCPQTRSNLMSAEVKLRGENFELEMKKKDPVPIDTRLENVDKAYKQGLGMALETRRLDKAGRWYAQLSAMTLLTSKAFRERVLQAALVDIHTSVKEAAPEAPPEPVVPEGPEMSEQAGTSCCWTPSRIRLMRRISAADVVSEALCCRWCGKNLEWLAKASNWAKFSATASLGVIHKGHIKESRSILSTYLPQQGGTRGSPYSEGGALYGMGLIHANHYDQETKAYLLEQLHNAQATEVLQHGACLGIGLLCMATADERIYDELTQTLYTDTAVAGEAAAYAIGLVMVAGQNAPHRWSFMGSWTSQEANAVEICWICIAKSDRRAEFLLLSQRCPGRPDGPWSSCLEQAVKYEQSNQAQQGNSLSLQPEEGAFAGHFGWEPKQLDSTVLQGQVVELFAERVVETQIHLEDCLQSIEEEHWAPARLRAYAHDTQHEKIIRACVRRAVSDVSDDVRRAAVMAYPEPLQPPKKEETAKAATAASSSADVDMDDKGAASSVRGADIVSWRSQVLADGTPKWHPPLDLEVSPSLSPGWVGAAAGWLPLRSQLQLRQVLGLTVSESWTRRRLRCTVRASTDIQNHRCTSYNYVELGKVVMCIFGDFLHPFVHCAFCVRNNCG